jgi:Predicted membrane protein (DUF2142)
VAFVAQTGGLPELRAGDWDSALLERLKTGTMLPGDSVSAIRYESWQPPLSYVVAAPIFRLGDTSDPAAVLLRLRAFDAVLGGVMLLVAYAIAREALQPEIAAAVPAVIVGVPMFTAVSASLSADPLADLLAAVLILQLVRRLRRSGRADAWSITVGVLLGLGLLTKLALAIFVPLALVVIFVRATRRVRESAIVLATTALVVSPWLVHQVTTYGWTDPFASARHAAVVADQPRFPGFSPEYLVQFLTITFHSFWAQFGWMAIVAQDRLYWTWGVLMLVGAAGWLLRRHCLREPTWQLYVVTVVAALAAYVGYNLTFEQPQGRYLFTALVPIAILLVGGWAAVFPRRVQSVGVLGIAVVLIALNVYTLLRVVVLGFAPAT